jgi:hypothetical protein
MGAVHDLDDFAIDIAGHDTFVNPFLLKRFRSPFDVLNAAFRFAPLGISGLSHLERNLVDVAIHFLAVHLNRGSHAEMWCDIDQLDRILDFVVFRLLPGH